MIDNRLEEQKTRDANRDVTKDVASIIQPKSHDNGTPKSAVNTTIYLTDGELIPWKKTWWRVRLREINGEKIVTLEKTKATAKSQKRSLRAERWNVQHAKRKGVKREVAALSKLIHGSGQRFGSQELQQAQA